MKKEEGSRLRAHEGARSRSLDDHEHGHDELVSFLRSSIIAEFLGAGPVLELGGADPAAAEASQAVVLSVLRLQEEADYRLALRDWFRLVRTGGHLIVVVPHAFLHERQLALPSRWQPSQRRLYTPASLIEEVEEALPPNSYRVRQLSDLDQGYDYNNAGLAGPPAGRSEIVLVLEKVVVPAWTLSTAPPQVLGKPPAQRPDYDFEPQRTRVEAAVLPSRDRVLLLKLDHLGDFIMSVGTLQRARALFANSEITLVVGSWNLEMARSLEIADRIIPFDVFPRNSSEEEVDVVGKTAQFQAAVTGEYDLAIDLRTDWDTRFLLNKVKARVRAGIGTHAQFPYLDIFLPIDFTRNEPETAREYLLNHHAFASQGSTLRKGHRVVSRPDGVERDCAIVWGPYWQLRAGRYIFEPYIEFEQADRGLLLLDVALDARRVAENYVEGSADLRLPFTVDLPSAQFEFRIWTVADTPSISFSFFGGRLIREGAASVLHQSEYSALLLELISLRTGRTGMLQEVSGQ